MSQSFQCNILTLSFWFHQGVAGLAAIQTAKNMGAVVRAFDVRPVTKEQVESMGATFLEVPFKEDGSGSGGYAKEMSDGFKKAQAEMMLEQAKDVDIIITTAVSYRFSCATRFQYICRSTRCSLISSSLAHSWKEGTDFGRSKDA